MARVFEWDPVKAENNAAKHGVSFHEAMTVLSDPLSLTRHDPRHSGREDRYVTVGESSNRRVLVVIHTDRREAIRLISARLATRKEREQYEETT